MVIVWRANYVEISKGMASSVVKVQAQDDIRAPGLQTPSPVPTAEKETQP